MEKQIWNYEQKLQKLDSENIILREKYSQEII